MQGTCRECGGKRGRVLKEALIEYQWLVGLLIGFFLNQIAVSIDRTRKTSDVNMSFKKHVLFMKNQLNYISVELERIPFTQIMNEDYKNMFIKNLENLREEIISIDKNSIPNKLTEEVTDVAGDLLFFINTIKGSTLGREIYRSEETLDVAKDAARRQRLNVKRIFDHLNIKTEY